VTAGTAPSGLGTVERQSTTGQIVHLLRDAIVGGAIQQGEQLRETWLSDEFHVSRSSLREALRQLVQEGLVEHQVHRGTFVRRISPDDAVDVYRAREAVEVAALDVALRRGGELDLTVLDACIAEMRDAAAREGSSFRELVEPDVSFHEGLVSLGGSLRLVRMYSTLAAETRMILYAYPPYPPGANVDDHSEILEALRARSPTAETLLREHLRFSALLAAESLARGST
jgi:DNA-binding GntR family transcriptional regulator